MIPIYDMIQDYIKKNPTIFHMPGHKGQDLGLYKDMIKWDLTEIYLTDDLHEPKGSILKAMNIAAKDFGAKKTFFLVNGSTGGIHAAILSVLKRGDKIIVGRDCHKSVLNILTYLEARVVFVNPQYNCEFGICGGYCLKDIIDAVEKNQDSVAVLITSPNYYGICSDIEKIAKVVHNNNKILIVDEAHGANLNFCDKLPKSALLCDADIVVQSAHKTLPALTQTGYLHINGDRINETRLKRILKEIQTSSPSFILMASLDIARHILKTSGQERINNLCNMIDKFKAKFSKLKILSDNYIKEGRHDKTRLVINFKDYGILGYDVERIMRERYNIIVEMADLYNIVCITTLCDKEESFNKLGHSLEEMLENRDIMKKDLPEFELMDDLEEIWLKDVRHCDSELVNLKDSVGRISYNMIVPYPPGIPYIISGQEIKPWHVSYISSLICQNAVLNGVSDDLKIEVLKK